MSDLSLTVAACGRWQTNCVVVADHARREAVVVDPGETSHDVVTSLLGDLDVDPVGILLTHGHLDHLWAAPTLAAELDVAVHLHPADRWLWDNPGATLNVPAAGAGEVLRTQLGLDWQPDSSRLVDLDDNQQLSLAGQTITVAHTPGHTPGSVTFLLREVAGADLLVADNAADKTPDDVLLAGDLLFAGSVGRVDLPGGDSAAMLQSLRTHLPALDGDTLVVAGHGPNTTIGAELAGNPFVAQALAGTSATAGRHRGL